MECLEISRRQYYNTIPGFKNYIIFKNGLIIVRKKFAEYNIGDIIFFDENFIVTLYSDNEDKYVDLNIIDLLFDIFIGSIDLPKRFKCEQGKIYDYDYILNNNQVICKSEDIRIISSKSFKKIPGSLNYFISEDGMIYSEVSKYGFLKKAFNHKGYLRVGRIYNDKFSIEVHILVYITYNGEIPKGMTIDHVDGNKLNNHITNLELVDSSENVRRGYINDTRDDIKWSPDKLHYICRQMERGVNVKYIAKELNIIDEKEYRRFVVLCSSLRTGKIWTHIASQYDYSKYDKGLKLNIDDVIEICNMINNGYDDKYIASKFGVDRSNINSIRHRKSWNSISNKYLKSEINDQ